MQMFFVVQFVYIVAIKTQNRRPSNCRVSHDVTKIQTTKLLILLIFYFNEVEEQLKANIYANICSEWALGFAIDYAGISKL